MAREDKATDEQAASFAASKRLILERARQQGWRKFEYAYLEEVLDNLGMMIAFYSYGNGDISPFSNDKRASWLNPEALIPEINSLIEPELGLTVWASGFPALEFEQALGLEEQQRMEES